MSNTFPDPTVRVEEVLAFETPENVVFGYAVAGIGSRFLAAFVDTILIVVLQIVANLTLIFLIAVLGGGSILQLGNSGALSLLAGVFGLVAFALLWGYYIFFETLWNGQSPGKRWVGLRVIAHDGTPIGVSATLIRNLVRIVDFLPLYYGIGVVTMFIDRQSRRLGDFAAGTLVVYERGAITLEHLERATEQLEVALTRHDQAPGSGYPRLSLQRLQNRHVTLARSFLSRQPDLHNREQLAVLLAQKLQSAMELPVRALSYTDAISLLEAVAGHIRKPVD